MLTSLPFAWRHLDGVRRLSRHGGRLHRKLAYGLLLAQSLDKFRAKFGERIDESFILYTKDVMKKDGIMHLPLYMASCL